MQKAKKAPKKARKPRKARAKSVTKVKQGMDCSMNDMLSKQ